MTGKYILPVLLFALAPVADGQAPTVKEPALRQELLDLQQENQDTKAESVRVLSEKGVSFQKAQYVTDPATIKLLREQTAKVAKVEQKTRARLKAIMDKHGWPGKSLVGSDGAEAAWFLVLQSQKDLPLQKRCLKLIKEAPKGEVEPAHVAQLTDSVLIAERKKQIYGTGLQGKNGVLKPYPIEDEANVDKRRAEVGLPPLDEFLQQAQQKYDEVGGKK
jgi:hypothetical protein